MQVSKWANEKLEQISIWDVLKKGLYEELNVYSVACQEDENKKTDEQCRQFAWYII